MRYALTPAVQPNCYRPLERPLAVCLYIIYASRPKNTLTVSLRLTQFSTGWIDHQTTGEGGPELRTRRSPFGASLDTKRRWEKSAMRAASVASKPQSWFAGLWQRLLFPCGRLLYWAGELLAS